MGKRFDQSWEPILGPLLDQPYMAELSFFVQQARNQGRVFPPRELVFNAFKLTGFDSLKVVILGQDPYHNDGQAHGLAFSVPDGIALPPSLKNIFKELETDIPGFKTPRSGDLSHWAKQGVLLLNATLTVNAHQAGSHQKRGWEHFTDQVIEAISDQKDAVVFLLWGAYAQKKASLIDGSKHLILSTVHPSPLSVYRGFFGCRHFSQANYFLQKHGEKPIDWKLV
ncbi:MULTISPECIES: uracil-DNA glycosylase [Sphingobacterium]|jgi:uracil-DNA glycosylase|uniref:uracil-DNA glycosylase n=1 Tax=Sphingobacterium TaxID=28453 RepID=UPI0004E5FF74|nr:MULTISPECIES: uracil-DNA glycosylase [Sphingobacterium]CDS93101.1 uracil-DNA-glycosylase [Sphingobacterium sp. PM2-P1-29]SJN51161.1 Uracil-DNA glycosylase, family 1 [Sphingobacterium faecium PCAi_F2.5]HCU45741.1 uracil-DNA glycosylase [Sphingobacterium sp.]UXD69513.1 uracil-DNA glycosylase [Sphingobacterium faecium]WGQ13058.1 uracil-DNA glycosylase [Sphingobacterium faecium]